MEVQKPNFRIYFLCHFSLHRSKETKNQENISDKPRNITLLYTPTVTTGNNKKVAIENRLPNQAKPKTDLNE